MVSKKDREDYEEGRRDRKADTFTQVARDLSGDHPDTAAYYKGRRGEQLDADKDEDSGGGCFITTACIQARGLSDNCPDLQTLRAFRDDYIATLPHGANLLGEYYKLAPQIVAAINALPDSRAVYEHLYDALVARTLDLIRAGKPQDALIHLVAECTSLKKEYVDH